MTLIQSILFAMKHQKPELMDLGLESLYSLISKVVSEPNAANIFFP